MGIYMKCGYTLIHMDLMIFVQAVLPLVQQVMQQELYLKRLSKTQGNAFGFFMLILIKKP